MNTFMAFAFNTEKLKQHLRDEWMQCYDFDYIDNKIIGGVEKNLPAVMSIMQGIERKATGKITTQLSTSSSLRGEEDSQLGATTSVLNKSNTFVEDDRPMKQLTVPEPFNLTRAKPKMIPLPQVIKREVKANPVP